MALCRTTLGGLLGQVPGVRGAYGGWAMHRTNVGGVFSGSYASYDAARAAIPADRLAGWDSDEAAGVFEAPLPRQPSVYPVLFWLLRLLRAGDRIVDVGGGAAITQRQYTARAALPFGATWTVMETPAVARFGARLATEGKLTGVSFVDGPDDAGLCDVLLSAGALQYMADGAELLDAMLAKQPRIVILNKLPLSDAADYWTLQNFGPAVCPYRIWNREAFMAAVTGRGYVLMDSWMVSELTCDVPFYPDLYVPAFTGLVFVHADAAASLGLATACNGTGVATIAVTENRAEPETQVM